MMASVYQRVKWRVLLLPSFKALLVIFVIFALVMILNEVAKQESKHYQTYEEETERRQKLIVDTYMKELNKKEPDQVHGTKDELKLLKPEPIKKDRFSEPSMSLPPFLGLKIQKKKEYVVIKYPGKLAIGESSENSLHAENGEGKMNKGVLEGGPGHCRVYNCGRDINWNFDCVTISWEPVVYLCLYPNEEDVHLSKHVREEGIWEPHLVRLFQEKLSENPGIGFIDIGANIGQYSLIAATMGHKVVAVEPFQPNLHRFHKAILLSQVMGKITVVGNGVSFKRGSVELKTYADNQGGVALTDEFADPWCEGEMCRPQTRTILMDDLLEVINFDKAIIKIDIEGHEHKAFANSSKLLQSVFVPYIFMEWIKLRGYYGSDADESADKISVSNFVEFLTVNEYTAHSSVNGEVLNPDFWFSWSDDILWQHQSVEIS